MKRVIALLGLLALLPVLAGCHYLQPTSVPSSVTTPSASPTEPSTQPTTQPTPVADPHYQANYAENRVVCGSLEVSLSQDDAPEVSYNNPYKGTPGSDYTAPHVYTLRQYLPSGDNLNWSPMNWKTAEDAYILDYITMGLYSFTLNGDLTGWTIVTEMAASMPEDVTAEYVGQFGITEGETAKAWRIALNPQAYFSNGVAIDADTYLYSYQQLLDSRMNNFRASEVTQGDFAIAGAAEYHAGAGSWEDVGILKTGQFEIVLITDQPVPQPEFYVPYYLQNSYLVCQSLWETCKQYYDADGNLLAEDSEAAVTVTSTYGTSLKTSVSYGPYVLSSYKPGETLYFSRNFTWYGYMDGLHLGQYQADHISCPILSSYADILAAYEAGQLDQITLRGSDFAQYLDSGLLRQNPETYTTKLTFNTDPDALAARGNQVLANPLFRKAISLALDRGSFSTQYTAPGMTGLGLINEAYCGDVASFLIYRYTDSAVHVLNALYGDAVTGYDPETARELMRQAFDQCVADGSYDGVSPITLQLSVYREDETYTEIHSLLSQALSLITEDTGFAGKITLQLTVDENCYAAMAQGQTDIIFSTWGGNSFDPYSILYACYCSDSRMEYGFDPAALMVETEINGEVFSASLLQWALWCAGDAGAAPVSDGGTTLSAFHDYDAQSRAALFAELEFAYLSQYAVTPLYSRGSVWLLSEKGNYAVNNPLPLVGFGGVRYYTFTCTDAQWNTQAHDTE